LNLCPGRKNQIYIFFFFLSIYALTGQGSIQSSDGKIMYLLTRSLVEDHSLSFTEQVTLGDPEGEKYSKYGIGMSVLAIPFYLTGKLLAGILNIDAQYSTVFCVSMINALVTALTCVLIYGFGRQRLGYGHRTAQMLALGFGLSTIAWYYSEDFMSEPATSLFLLASAFVISGNNADSRGRNLILAGVLLGMALTLRLATIVALPGFLLYLILANPDARQRKWQAMIVDLSRFLVPVVFFIGLLFLYNYVRFQNIFETGYERGFGANGLTGFLGILFSPGKSVFLYNPLLIMGCMAAAVFFRKQSAMAFLFGWIVLSHLLLFSFWHSWYGGMGWGPRLMLVTFPYLILPVGLLLERRERRAKTGVLVAIILGVLIQIPSVTVNIARYYYDLRLQYPDRAHDMLLYSPAHSPLIGQVKEVAAVFNRLGDREFLDRLVAHAQAKTKFLGQSDREVLEKGLAINVPNFWWVFMRLFGYPVTLTFLPAIVLLSLVLFCGYKVYRDH